MFARNVAADARILSQFIISVVTCFSTGLMFVNGFETRRAQSTRNMFAVRRPRSLLRFVIRRLDLLQHEPHLLDAGTPIVFVSDVAWCMPHDVGA
jgi:hypothetical protein